MSDIAEYRISNTSTAEGEENTTGRQIHPLPPIYETDSRHIPARGNPFDVSGAGVQLYEDEQGQIYTATESGDIIPVMTLASGKPKTSGLLIAVGVIGGLIVLAAITGMADNERR